jgi:hypothetical protein
MMKKVYLKKEFVENYLLRNNKDFKWLYGKLGTSDCYLSLIFNKKRNLSHRMRETFMKFFDAKFDDLFEIEEV